MHRSSTRNAEWLISFLRIQRLYTCIMHGKAHVCVCIKARYPFQMHGSLQMREGVPSGKACVHGAYSGKDLVDRTW